MRNRLNSGGESQQGLSLENIGSVAKKHSVDEMTISELREVLSRRRIPLLLCLVIGFLGALAISFELPRRYEAVTRLAISNEPAISTGVEMLAQATGVVDSATLQTQVNVLLTDSMAWKVIGALRLDQRQETLPRMFGFGPLVCQSAPGQSIEAVSPECRQTLIDEFHKRLNVQALPRTEIIEIRYRCRSRYLAAEVANTIASLFIERNFQLKYESAMKNSAWLAGQMETIRRDAEEAARRLIAHQEETGSEGIDGGQNLVLSKLSGLSQQLVGVEAERIAREARYQTALTGDPEALASVSPGSTLQVLHAQEASLQNQYAELDSKFGDAYPAVIQVKEQLSKVREALNAELAHTTNKLKNEYKATEQGEHLLRDELVRQKQLVDHSTDAWVQMTLFNRETEATGELYQQVIKRLKMSGLLAADNGPDISIIDPASAPIRKVEPHFGLNLGAGVVIGFVVWVILAGLLEVFDPRIKTMKDVRELCPVSGVGVIPCIPGNSSAGPVRKKDDILSGMAALSEMDPEVSDAFRSLRTSLLHSGIAGPPRLILVTSPLSQEGSAVTAVNLAIAFAQMNRRVLLVDADLRSGEPGRKVSSQGSGGLAEALRGKDYRTLCMTEPKLGTLSALPAGDSMPNPSDLLDSARMRDLVAQWRQDYDHVIINAPRLISQTDAVILSTMVDKVLLTVRAGRGRRNNILDSIEVLYSVGSDLHGAVVTDLRKHGLFTSMTSWKAQPFSEPRTELQNASL